MSASLTERYVAIAMGQVRPSERADVESELRDLIEQGIRSAGDGVSPERAEEQALSELGDPEVLAAGYSTSRFDFLSPRMRPVFRRLIVPLPLVTAGAVFVLAAIGQLALGQDLGDAARRASGSAGLWAVLVAAAVTAVCFVVDRRRGEEPPPPWDAGRLRSPAAWHRPALASTIVSVLALALIGTALVLQGSVGRVSDGEGQILPVLSPDSWPPALPVLVGLVALQIVRSVAARLLPARALLFAGVNAVLQVAAVTVPVLMLLGGSVLDAGIHERLGLVAGSPLARLVDATLLGIIAVIALVDVVATLVRALRSRRRRPA